MTVTLPNVVGAVSIEKIESGHLVSVTITPGPTERTWTAYAKFVSMPETEVLANAAKRLLVDAVRAWLTEAAEVHPAIRVEPGWNVTPTSTTSSPSSNGTSPSTAGTAP